MTTTLEQYSALSDRLGAVVDSMPEGAWRAPSSCDDWTGRDVVAHLVDTTRNFFGRHDLDLGARPDLADPADPGAAWHAHDRAVRALVADESVASREFDGFFGPTTIGSTLVGFYGFDLMVHRWDLAQAAGRDERFGDEELDAIERAIEGFGEHLYDDGVCKPAVDVPAGADRQTKVLARLGRSARVSV
jgi:uncharacterized protein (TIGR03086 family)